MMRRHALLLLLIPTLAQAQSRCIDSLAGANWRSTPLASTIVTPLRGERDTDRYVDGVLARLGQQYRDPSAPLHAVGAMISVPTFDERQALGAELTLSIDRNGKLLGARLTGPTRIAGLDSAILRSAREAGAGRGFGKVPRRFRGDTLSIRIAISDRHPLGPGIVPLGNYSTSYLVADVPPRIRSMPPARAPRGRPGRRVLLAATVNSRGRVVPGSIRVVQTNDSSLIAVATRSLAQSIYRPGTKHGCPAESYIRQNFPFP